MVVIVVLETSGANCIAFGQYVLLAAGYANPTPWQIRGIALAALTFSCLLHTLFPKTGIRLLNILGVFKIVLLLLIVFAGFAALSGHLNVPKPDNFSNAFANSSADAYNYITAINNIIFTYAGTLVEVS
jgi:amino acid transporter